MYKATILAGTAAAALLGLSAPAFAAEAFLDEPEVTATSDGPPEAEEAPEPPPPPPPPPTISDQIAAGKFLFEARARYEEVDQSNLALRANAATLRTRLGWETGDWHNLRALVEFEDVRLLGAERFNVAVPGGSSVNGKTTYPIINDPAVTELNRATITWTPSASFQFTLGRQRILIDDQRFVGNVGWRQDEQTFDAARIDVALGRFKATYAYVIQANRIFGEALDWRSDSHLFNATYSFSEAARLQGFVYALDFENNSANSSITYGARLTGKTWVGLFQLAYGATYANQSEYGNQPAVFDLNYIEADIAGTFDIWTVKLTYESLEGNGSRGFSTPLATVHAFNGWSDAWAANAGNKTHVDGINDLNLMLVVRPRFKFTYLFNTEWTVRYHDFDAERTGADLAAEWDLQVTAAITTKLSAALKYASFDREETVPLGTTLGPPDRRKFWFTLEYKL